MDEKSLELRLEAARAAQERSRLAFFATTVISFAIITGGWNAYLSFYLNFARDHADLIEPNTTEQPGNNLGIQELQRQMLREWVSSRMINVSLLGIRVGVDDASTIGAVALFVAMVWFYLTIRRENFVIGFLVYDYKGSEHSTDTKWRIYHGINSYSVFTNVRYSDNPFCTIKDVPENKEIKYLRSITSKLYYLPFISLLLLLLLDISSLFRVSPFRASDRWLITTLWQSGSFGEIFRIFFWLVVSAILTIPILLLCNRTSHFANCTEYILKEFLELLEGETKAQGKTQGGVQEPSFPGSDKAG